MRGDKTEPLPWNIIGPDPHLSGNDDGPSIINRHISGLLLVKEICRKNDNSTVHLILPPHRVANENREQKRTVNKSFFLSRLRLCKLQNDVCAMGGVALLEEQYDGMVSKNWAFSQTVRDQIKSLATISGGSSLLG